MPEPTPPPENPFDALDAPPEEPTREGEYLQVGMVIEAPNGQNYEIVSADNRGVRAVPQGAVDASQAGLSASQAIVTLPPGQYFVPGQNETMNVGRDGRISSRGKPLETDTPTGPTGDPFAAGKFALQKYAALLDTREMTVDEAMTAWQADWDEIVSNSNIESTNVGNQLAADTSNATLAGNRAADIALNQSRLNQEATARAQLKNTILKGAVPHGTEVNFSGFGKVPTHPVNLNQMLSGGLPSLAEQFGGLDALFPQANIQPGTVAPVQAPPMPNLPPMPALPF